MNLARVVEVPRRRKILLCPVTSGQGRSGQIRQGRSGQVKFNQASSGHVTNVRAGQIRRGQ
eukprot:11055852-Karenia_brevis.AAC.1